MRFFDLHCDTLGRALDENQSLTKNNFHVDLLEGKKYKPYIGCFAVWISDELRGDAAFNYFKRAYEKLESEKITGSALFEVIKNKNDLKNVIKNDGTGIILTVEGGAAIAGKLENIKFLSDCGVKIMTLTWNGTCELGDGVGVENAKGLTAFGKSAVKEMEKQNIIVDISHASVPMFFDVCEISEKPFIATHSNAKKICKHKRNLTDEQFEIIKKSGGLIGINFCTEFLNNNKENASFEDIFAHIEHFLSIGGKNTISIGSDFDGTDLPNEMMGLANIENLYEFLLKKNYSESLMDKIFFENAYNFCEENFAQ